jgi:hypothetical protein
MIEELDKDKKKASDDNGTKKRKAN